MNPSSFFPPGRTDGIDALLLGHPPPAVSCIIVTPRVRLPLWNTLGRTSGLAGGKVSIWDVEGDAYLCVCVWVCVCDRAYGRGRVPMWVVGRVRYCNLQVWRVLLSRPVSDTGVCGGGGGSGGDGGV
jgi:hypothetical protein